MSNYRQKFVTSVQYTPDENLSARLSNLSSLNVVSESHVLACPNLVLCHGSPHPHVLEISIGWEWMRNSDKAQRGNCRHLCLCDPGCLQQICVKKIIVKFHYVQIPCLTITCKFQLVTFTANYLQILTPLLLNSITCKFSAPDKTPKY